MIRRPLTLVSETDPPSLATRAARAKAEQALIVREAVSEMTVLMEAAEAAAQFVADLDSALVGVRNLARRYAEQTRADRNNVVSISARMGR